MLLSDLDSCRGMRVAGGLCRKSEKFPTNMTVDEAERCKRPDLPARQDSSEDTGLRHAGFSASLYRDGDQAAAQAGNKRAVSACLVSPDIWFVMG